MKLRLVLPVVVGGVSYISVSALVSRTSLKSTKGLGGRWSPKCLVRGNGYDTRIHNDATTDDDDGSNRTAILFWNLPWTRDNKTL